MEYNKNIDEIPHSELYTVKLTGNKVSVYDADLNKVYHTEVDIHSFTESDLKQLKQDGLKFAVRSELIEILNYISD